MVRKKQINIPITSDIEWLVPVLISVQAETQAEAETKALNILPSGSGVCSGQSFPRKEKARVQTKVTFKK